MNALLNCLQQHLPQLLKKKNTQPKTPFIILYDVFLRCSCCVSNTGLSDNLNMQQQRPIFENTKDDARDHVKPHFRFMNIFNCFEIAFFA